MKPPKTGGKRQLSDTELWAQLSNSNTLRSNEDQVLCSISGIFWAANAILLVVLFQNGKLPDSHLPRLVISAVGAILSLTQYFLQGRTLGHIKRYEELIKRIELKLNFDDRYAISADLNAEDADRYLGKRGNVWHKLKTGTPFRVRKLMQCTSMGGTLLWLIAFVIFLYAAICGR